MSENGRERWNPLAWFVSVVYLAAVVGLGYGLFCLFGWLIS